MVAPGHAETFNVIFKKMLYKPYRDFLAEVFPGFRKVRKMPLSGGMTCPNLDGTKGFSGCAYCNNRSFSPVWNLAKVSVEEQIATLLPPLREKYPEAGVLAYFQPYTNTYAPVDRLREILSAALFHPDVAGISVGTRPDCLADPVVELLAELNEKKRVIVEVGLQSAADKTLNAINRRHTFREFQEAVERLRRRGLSVTTHVIVGLPGESVPDFLSTARAVRDLGISAVKIHPLHIVCGTRLAEEYASAEFELLSFEDFCEAVALMILEMGTDVAIERFSGESPGDLLIAPSWSGDRNRIAACVENHLKELKHEGLL